MGKIISITNFKGGVGKTATAFNLAAALWACGKSVCIIDCDDQADLTFRMNCSLTGSPKEDDCVETLYGWLKHYNDLSDDCIPIQERYDRFCFVPSRSSLATIELTLESMNRRDDAMVSNYYLCLKNCLDYVRDCFDYIILDCPPSTGFISTCAFIATDEVIIPVTCSGESLDGVEKVCQRMDAVCKTYKKQIALRGCLLTCYQARHKVSKRFIKSIEDIQQEAALNPELISTSYRYSLSVLNTKIRIDKNFKDCAGSFANIFEYEPESNGVDDYMQLAKELYHVTPPVGWKNLAPKYWEEKVLPTLTESNGNT